MSANDDLKNSPIISPSHYLRASVRAVLQHASAFEWTTQGFGFIRTYFPGRDSPKEFRLNVWHSALRVPNVSTIHDHPWNMESVILAGTLFNKRFVELPDYRPETDQFSDNNAWRRVVISNGLPVDLECQVIRTGEGGGPIEGTRRRVNMYEMPATFRPTHASPHGERYTVGDTYWQRASEVHETRYLDGTVTLNHRVGDTGQARVFWPAGQEWVDAIPRRATPQEVAQTAASALERFA